MDQLEPKNNLACWQVDVQISQQYLEWISGSVDELEPQIEYLHLLAGSSSLPWKSVLSQDLEAVR